MFEHDYKNYPELTNRQLNEFGFSSPHKQYTEDFVARVVKVHDGDTVTLTSSERDFSFPLRLLNIDAPELSEGGAEARDWLKSRIFGEIINVLIDKRQRVGKYGRLLGRILFGGLDVSEEMLSMGLVWKFENRKEGRIPNITKWYREGGIHGS